MAGVNVELGLAKHRARLVHSHSVQSRAVRSHEVAEGHRRPEWKVHLAAGLMKSLMYHVADRRCRLDQPNDQLLLARTMQWVERALGSILRCVTWHEEDVDEVRNAKTLPHLMDKRQSDSGAMSSN